MPGNSWKYRVKEPRMRTVPCYRRKSSTQGWLSFFVAVGNQALGIRLAAVDGLLGSSLIAWLVGMVIFFQLLNWVREHQTMDDQRKTIAYTLTSVVATILTLTIFWTALQPNDKLSMHVVSTENKPYADIAANIFRLDGNGTVGRVAITDDLGIVFFDKLEKGRYYVILISVTPEWINTTEFIAQVGKDAPPLPACVFPANDVEHARLPVMYFGQDSTLLTRETNQKILHIISTMHEPKHSDSRLLIHGHCSAIGSSRYNDALGERRAAAVRDKFILYGIESGRIFIASYGKRRIITSGDNESAHSQNRRVECFLIPGKNHLITGQVSDRFKSNTRFGKADGAA